MPRIRIEIESFERSEVITVREIERSHFPREFLLTKSGDGYVFEVRGERARYLLDLMRIETDDPAFEPFNAWQERSEDQIPLFVG